MKSPTKLRPEEVLDQEWNFLEVNTRTWGVLACMAQDPQLKIKTVRDVCRLTRGQLLKRKNCGKKTIVNLMDELHSFGLQLHRDYPQATDSNPLRQYGYWDPKK